MFQVKSQPLRSTLRSFLTQSRSNAPICPQNPFFCSSASRSLAFALAASASPKTKSSSSPKNIFFRKISDDLNLIQHLIAAFFSSSMAVAAMHPIDTIKTVLQRGVVPGASSVLTAPGTGAGAAGTAAAAVAPPRMGILGAIRAIIDTSGLAGFYAGVMANVASQAPAGAIKFASFEILQQCCKNIDEKYKNIASFVNGALAFVACSVILVPGEVCKQRLQAGLYGKNANFFSVVKEIIHTESWKGLYTGYLSVLMRDVPYTMLEFGLYAELKRLLRIFAKKEKLSPQEEFSMGGIAGGLTGFLTTPLDVAKTKIMTQPVNIDPALRYKGVLDVWAKIYKSEGIQGLFCGGGLRVIWLVPFTALYFGLHEFSKRTVRNISNGLSEKQITNTNNKNEKNEKKRK